MNNHKLIVTIAIAFSLIVQAAEAQKKDIGLN